jgi:hypothetical protein
MTQDVVTVMQTSIAPGEGAEPTDSGTGEEGG